MRLVALAFLVMIPVALSIVSTADASKCVTEKGHVVCEYPNEPASVACFSVDGKQVACVHDPCGTTACF